MSTTAAEEVRRLGVVRLQMLDHHPFWGHLLMSTRLVASPGLGAIAATDCCRTIWYDPERTAALDLPELGFVLAHELGHVLYESRDRRQGRQRHLWNCATDYAINRVVAHITSAIDGAALYRPPAGVLLDPRFDDRIAEVIYEVLAAEQPAPPSIIVVSLAGSGGQRGLQIPNVMDHGGGIDVHLPRELTDAERDEVATRIASAVSAWHESGQRGSVPGSLIEEVRVQPSGRIPWTVLLREWVDAVTGVDEYTLARPNRRYLQYDIVAPGLYGERVGHAVIAVDTSASVSPAQLAAIARELRPLNALAEQCTVIIADAEVQAVVSGAELEQFLRRGQFPGRGGTDHRPVFRWLEEHHVQPDLFVGLTDLYSRFPTQPPGWPVLWITPQKHGRAPFGRVIAMEEMD